METNEQLFAKQNAAINEVAEARNQLEGAMKRYSDAVWAETNLGDEVTRRVRGDAEANKDLVQLITQNRAEWSGGVLTLSNIIESVARKAAIERLSRFKFTFGKEEGK